MDSFRNKNTSLNVSGDNLSCDPNLPFLETVVFCCLHSISAFSALTGNFLVLISIYCTRQLWTKHNVFIFSMALADFLVGLLIGPLYIANAILRVWLTDHVLFKMENFLWIQTLAATTLSMCAVSVDRYYAVTSPIKYRVVITAQRCEITVVFIWLLSCVLACLIFFMATENQIATLFFTTQILTVGIPLLVICYCYVCILKATRAREKRISNAPTSEDSRKQAKENAKQRKTSLTIAIIIGLFVVLFTPNFVFSVLVFMVRDPCQEMIYYRDWYWGVLVAFLASAINPWIYAIRMRGFGEAMKRTVGKILPCCTLNPRRNPLPDVDRHETNEIRTLQDSIRRCSVVQPKKAVNNTKC